MPLKTLEEMEKCWLACALDTEGNIDFRRHSQKQGVAVMLSISNTSLPFIDKVYSIANVGRVRVIPPKPPWKQIYTYYLSGLQNCATLLRQLMPYLIIKQEKAKQVILFADYRQGKGQKRYGAYEQAILKGDVKELEEIRRLL